MIEQSQLKCEYDTNKYACFSCVFKDCIRSDIKSDEIKELVEPTIRMREKYKQTYEKTDAAYKERLSRKKQGLPMPEKVYKCKGRRAEYQREYRANMPKEQRERYNARQREYIREKRARMKNVPVSIVQG